MPSRITVRSEPARPALAWIALALLLAGTGIYLFHVTRDTTFWQDEWDFLLFRRGGDLATYLDPHNNHLSLEPVALYKLLFATAGLDHYAPYRVLVIVLHLLVCALVFVYARRRAGDVLALAAAALILFFGPAWQNIIWPFQIGWLVSLAAGVGMLLVLDRRDRAGDVAAAALLAVSIAGSGLGLAFAAGVIIELLLRREPRRLARIVGVPLVLYAAWYVGYGGGNRAGATLAETPQFGAEAFASAVAALTGLAGNVFGDGRQALDWGRPLAVVAVGLLAWRVYAARRLAPRLGGLIGVALCFWGLTALSRGAFANPWESRYLYVGGLLVVLAALELIDDVEIPAPVVAAVTGLVAIVVVSNVGPFRQAGDLLRGYAGASRAQAAALDIARPRVPRDFLFVRYGDIEYPAGAYYDAIDELGSFGDTPAQLLAEHDGARQRADAVMASALAIRLVPGVGEEVSAAPAPRVTGVRGGTARARAACAVLVPDDTAAALELVLPPGGIRIRAPRGAGASVSVRRFASTFQPPLGSVRGGAGVLRAPTDGSRRPWQVRVASGGRVTACALG